MNTPENETPDGEMFLKQLDAALSGENPTGEHASLAKFGAELKSALNDREEPTESSAPEDLRRRLHLRDKSKPKSSVVKLDRKLARYRLGILDIAALLAVAVLGGLIWSALKTQPSVSKGDPVPEPVSKKESHFAAEDEKAPIKSEKQDANVPTLVAEVLAVRTEKGLVMVNVGSDRGIKSGDRFTVKTGENKTTIVVIDRVYPDMSSAKALIALEDINVGQTATLIDRIANAPVAVIEEVEPWKAEIRRKLSRSVTFDFVDTPLDEVIVFMRSLTAVNFVVDPKVAAEGKLKVPITLRVENLKMETAFTWILRLADLEWDIRNQAVFITSKRDEGVPELRIYDVADLPVSPEFLNSLLRMDWHRDFKIDTDKVSLEAQKGKLLVLHTPRSHEVLSRALKNIRKGAPLGLIELTPAEPDPEWKKEIRQKLQRKVTFEFVDTPLEEALAFLRSLTTVSFVIDPKVMDKNVPAINLRVTDMSLDLALEWILRLADLEYDLRDNVVFVGKGVSPGPTVVAYKTAQFAATVKLNVPASPENLAQAIREKFPKEWYGSHTVKVEAGWLLVCQEERIHTHIKDWLNGKEVPQQPEF